MITRGITYTRWEIVTSYHSATSWYVAWKANCGRGRQSQRLLDARLQVFETRELGVFWHPGQTQLLACAETGTDLFRQGLVHSGVVEDMVQGKGQGCRSRVTACDTGGDH